MTIKTIKKNLVTVCVLITILVVGVAVKDYMVLDQARVDKEANELKLAKVKKEIIEIQESLDQYEEEKKEIKKYLFEEKDVPAFLDGISKHAAETAVNILDMKTQKFQEVSNPATPAARRTKYGTRARKSTETVDPEAQLERALTLAAMPINIKVEGTFADFIKFLNRLEEFKQLTTISNVKISSKRKEYPVLDCVFTLKIYSFKTIEELEYK